MTKIDCGQPDCNGRCAQLNAGIGHCTCEELPRADQPCPTCQQVHREVWQELYETNPEFRAEMDKWHSIDSPEGQAILAQLDGQIHD
jgi:hypothetical protein